MSPSKPGGPSQAGPAPDRPQTDPRSRELAAFASVDFAYTRPLTSIWHGQGPKDQHLNPRVLATLLDDFAQARDPDTNVLGSVLVGAAGTGKTHLMGNVRAGVMKSGAYFILLDLAGVKNFWTTAALSFVTSVHQPAASGKPQFRTCLEQIIQLGGEHFSQFKKLFSKLKSDPRKLNQDSRQQLIDSFLSGLFSHFGHAAFHHQAVVRAYLYQLLGDDTQKYLAYAWLMGMNDLDDAAAATLKLPAGRDPHLIVKGTLWMLSRTASTLIAVDQIDAIIAQHNILERRPDNADLREAATVNAILQGMVCGLMDLYDMPGRSMVTIACLPETWPIIVQQSIKSVPGRFRERVGLAAIASAEQAQDVVLGRLHRAYQQAGFVPPYPSYPFKPQAFASAQHMLPRQLLQECESHRVKCRHAGVVTELATFSNVQAIDDSLPMVAGSHPLDAALSTALARLQPSDCEQLWAPTAEAEAAMSALLVQGLDWLAEQLGHDHPDIDFSVQGEHRLANAPLTARFKAVYREESDREIHVCLRVLPHTNALAFQARLRAAMTESGQQRELAFRHLLVLRKTTPPQGIKTQALVEQALAAGARLIEPLDGDWTRLTALASLQTHEGFPDWLRHGQHLQQISLLAKVMALVLPPSAAPGTAATPPATSSTSPGTPVPLATTPSATAGPAPGPTASPPALPARPQAFDPASLPVGRRWEGGQLGQEQTLPTQDLRRHVAILAGSGSGKTVLIRRLVEEAVLRGMPAVVLDPNNDLSLLGDAWPTPPAGWSAADAALAQRYLARVEVVVWTPGASRGRPIMLDAVPDFQQLSLDPADPDPLNEAIQMTVATVAGLVNLNAIQVGVLSEAVRAFALRKLTGLATLANLLQDLPADVSKISKASTIACAIGDKIHAAIASNPLLSAQGTPLDPARLFESNTPGKVRLSVISFAGLNSDEAKRDLVHRLQMALFTYVKSRPSPTGRLYVMDEAHLFLGQRPEMGASRESGRSLVAQARKYGLGVVVATQNPKDLHHTIISSCTTHFYGKMNSPASINAIQELAANKGGQIRDMGALPQGVFYYSSDNQPVPVRLRTALCLSHHPANPPSGETVIQRAAAAMASGATGDSSPRPQSGGPR